MTPALFAALGAAWLTGALIVAALWPRARGLRADAALILPLGFGAGLGVTSATFFFASICTRQPALPAALADGSLALIAAWVAWRRRRGAAVAPREGGTLASGFLAVVFAQVAVVAAVAASRAWATEPFGGWDGWAIWNMRARFIARAGPEWIESLRLTQLGWSHLDYPLLVSASVARAWAWAGAELPTASGLIGCGLAAASVAVLIAAAARLRGPAVAWIAGLTLAATPFFMTFAGSGHADIPLGFFVLATVALLARGENESGAPALAGVMAGLAAWTKNEGLLFAAVAAIAWSAWAWRSGRGRAALVFLGGLAVAAVPLGYFKFALAPGNDVVSAELGSRIAQVFAPARHAEIWAALWRDVAGFGEWRVVPLAVLALALVAPGAARLAAGERAAAAALALTFAGYYVVYLITPWELRGHLASSLVRLLLQLWPAALLLWCMLAVRPGVVVTDAWRRVSALGVLFSAIVAGLILWRLDEQCSPAEIAAARIDGGAISVTAGDGWFGPEKHERDTWRWSRGESVLYLHVEAAESGARVRFRFAMRSLVPRTVTIMAAGREIWRGDVGERLMPIEVGGVELPVGVTRLDFASDTPATQESAQAGARELAFALYNLRLE